MPVYIFVGIPGSGKDTQADLLSAKLGIPSISSGNSIKDYFNNHKDVEEKVLSSFQQGPDFPTDVLVDALNERAKQLDISKGFILNLKPNSTHEVDVVFDWIKENGFQAKLVFNIAVSTQTAIDRALKRLGGNFTIKEPSIEKLILRIDNYEKVFPEVLEYIKQKNRVIDVDGEKDIEEIAKDVLENIQ